MLPLGDDGERYLSLKLSRRHSLDVRIAEYDEKYKKPKYVRVCRHFFPCSNNNLFPFPVYNLHIFSYELIAGGMGEPYRCDKLRPERRCCKILAIIILSCNLKSSFGCPIPNRSLSGHVYDEIHVHPLRYGSPSPSQSACLPLS